MFFKNLFGKKEESAPTPTASPAATPHPLEQAVAGLTQQDKAQALSSAAQMAQMGETQRNNLADFHRLRDGIILPAFQDTIILFQKHGGRAHVGKANYEEWAGETVRLNIYGIAEHRGPFMIFAFPDPRKRDVRVTKTLIESAVVDIGMDELNAERVKREIASFIEDVRKHRQK
jgi:hypothetical protein